MDEPTELPEPFRSLLYDFQTTSSDETFEGMSKDFRPNIPEPLLDEPTKSILDESIQTTVEESRDVFPDEYLQTLLDDLNRTLPDDIPRLPRDEAIQYLRYHLVKRRIDKDRNFFKDCRQNLLSQYLKLSQYRKLQYDKYRQHIRDGRPDPMAGGSPQQVRQLWQRLYPEFRDKYTMLKPQIDGVCGVAERVQAIIRLLCERDERFSFINSALEEFVNGKDGLQDFRQSLDHLFSMDPNELEDIVVVDKLSEILAGPISKRQRDPANGVHLMDDLCEIIDSSIYELLNVFRDITIEQSSIGTGLIARFDLLYDLYKRTKLSTPQPAIQVAPKPWHDSGNEACYQYPSCLNSAVGGVRILEILPGTGDAPIECRLVVRNLYHDDIPEALSYVWGKAKSTKSILIDDNPFIVKKNLHGILRGLRRPDTTREIWIDAICINQSDFKEKTDQVQLMKEIYSRTKNTIVWLSGGHAENKQVEGLVKGQMEAPVENQREDQSFNMEGLYTPIPIGLGGVDVDQYDLAALLRESLKYSMDAPWCEKQTLLYMMVIRCVALVMLHSWWERVWTIQEAACPPNAPIFVFHGYSFSFDDLSAAVNTIAGGISSGNKHVIEQIENAHHIMGSEARKVVSKIFSSQLGLLSLQPLLFEYRRGRVGERYSASKTFTVLITISETYRATDPRDKIFALQSLLPGCMGLLIKVDYKEHCEAVFRRASARYYNNGATFYLMGTHTFWFESPLSAQEPAGPSWVIDFSYTDAGYRGSNKSVKRITDKVTLEGFISENGLSALQIDDVDNIYLCTSTTVFCTGRCIDQIRWVKPIPRLSDAATFAEFTVLVSNARESILGLPATTQFGDDANTEFLSLSNFLLMQDKEPLCVENRDELVNIRNQELAGKPVFITEKGLVGIAATLIKPGDSLSWLRGAPIYLILREVKDRDSSSDNAPQDQIVARAAVNENLIPDNKDMKDLIYSTPSCSFQIV
ncbi:heterokaryon incompatibility protein-domain-containing protein [Daldinia vernicosa]|uniref:heterokaryon incompatibility protein-domain-containing protein n=1 Tax=Daldinia vernicosa TaxID=114800 RepID=UPI002007CB87|nr:heterokaryon incompatibility protein-domain-containing protein [Daldinia vernicosa]KAI0852450.1 heterokaryon incompatibility protein-domain-containing protein [Daldinia vernicosa]